MYFSFTSSRNFSSCTQHSITKTKLGPCLKVSPVALSHYLPAQLTDLHLVRGPPGRVEAGRQEEAWVWLEPHNQSLCSIVPSPLASSIILFSGWDSLKAIMSSMKGKACWDMKQPWKVLQARLPIDSFAKFVNKVENSILFAAKWG